MKALSTSFHMLYCLSQNSKYSLRYGRMTIAVWELSRDRLQSSQGYADCCCDSCPAVNPLLLLLLLLLL